MQNAKHSPDVSSETKQAWHCSSQCNQLDLDKGYNSFVWNGLWLFTAALITRCSKCSLKSLFLSNIFIILHHWPWRYYGHQWYQHSHRKAWQLLLLLSLTSLIVSKNLIHTLCLSLQNMWYTTIIYLLVM